MWSYRKRLLLFLFLLLVILFISGCGGGKSAPTPTPCPPGPYDPLTESNSIKIRVNIVQLYGVSVNWKDHVDAADRIFDDADVSIRAELKPSLSLGESNDILDAQKPGNPNALDIRSSEVAHFKSEEECILITSSSFDCSGELRDINDPYTYEEYLNPRFNDGRITMYYVPHIKIPGLVVRGKAYRLQDGDPPSFIVSALNGNAIVWSHELGHVLGLLHVFNNNTGNLMYSPGASSSGLEQWQLDEIHQNASSFDGH